VPIWAPFAAMAAVLILVGTFAAALYGVLSATDPSIDSPEDLPDSATLVLTLLQDAIFVLAAFIAVKLALGRPRAEDFGLRRVSDLRTTVKWSIGVYVGFWTVTIVLALIFGQPDDQQLVTEIKAEESLGILVAYGVLICLLAPLVEELFFRGFMFTVFVRRLGVAWAAVLGGVIFGVGHAPAAVIQVLALGAFGVGLCLLYWRTRSIIPGMALHALNNSITFGLVKSLDPALFAGVVVVSVATVVAAGTALSARSAVAA
jgi:membrane protease YdiL (CAAX protease family)